MYRNNLNEYEKRADEIRRASYTKSENTEINSEVFAPPQSSRKKFSPDDLLLAAIILFLVREKSNDKMLIFALVFIFMSGF